MPWLVSSVVLEEMVTMRRPVKTPRASRRCELLAVTYMTEFQHFPRTGGRGFRLPSQV